MAPNKTSDVGYGRPPIETRFKKGASGKTAGRAKDAKDLKTDLQEELAELVSIREGRRRYQVTKQRALVKSLVAAAVRGDTKAAAAVFALSARALGAGEGDDAQNGLSPKDERVAEEFIDREVVRRLKNREALEARHEG